MELWLNLNWELDFWGRFRRAIASADASLDASVAGYDDVLVTLLGDVATNYVTVRTAQERIKLLQANTELQRGVLQYIDNRLQAGFKQTRLDLAQALSTLRQTEAGIPQLEITSREAENSLCILLGMPPADLTNMLGIEPIPVSPPDVVIGIPADLLRRRPDVRRAERLAAAQAEQIGIAQSDLYPAFSINGNFGYTANNFPDLFKNTAFNGSVGPSFQWNLLNYGRIVNNVRYQDAKFQELVVTYQNTVLQANQEVENGLVEFLRSQRRSRLLDESVVAAQEAVEIVITQYQTGRCGFQPIRRHRAELGHAARLFSPGSRPNIPRSDRCFPCLRRRLGNPSWRRGRCRRRGHAGCLAQCRRQGVAGSSRAQAACYRGTPDAPTSTQSAEDRKNA